ncbi:hypothetical protein [Stenotrophomonas geniculata]|uniref:hypothetical protein n=1 Tax=Stenotrophomonas geniculata TaxID=86188 RepID=UPI002E75BE64|nr:hypothetical protein [Stenotrophomonas geniculata]
MSRPKLSIVNDSGKSGSGSGDVALGKGDEPPHDADMEKRVSDLEAVIPTLATKLDLAELRSEMHKGFNEQIKWIVGTGLAGIVFFTTIMTFVLNNAVPKAPAATPPAPVTIQAPQAAPPPPPIIIQMPAQTPVAAPAQAPPPPAKP